MPFTKKKTWIGIAVAFAVLVAGAMVVKIRMSRSTWVSPRKGPVVEAVYGLGTVTSRKTYHLKLAITTGVKQLFVREGDAVTAGQPLVKFEEGVVHKAPFAGTVTSLLFEEGETVSPNANVLILADLNDRYLTLSIDQQAALRVRPGQKARVAFETLRGQKFIGDLRSIYPRDGEFIAAVEIKELPPTVLPGMTADVVLEVGQKENALLIPIAAVQSGRVTVEREGQRVKLPVTLGVLDGQWGEVLTGDIRDSDRLLLGGK